MKSISFKLKYEFFFTEETWRVSVSRVLVVIIHGNERWFHSWFAIGCRTNRVVTIIIVIIIRCRRIVLWSPDTMNRENEEVSAHDIRFFSLTQSIVEKIVEIRLNNGWKKDLKLPFKFFCSFFAHLDQKSKKK